MPKRLSYKGWDASVALTLLMARRAVHGLAIGLLAGPVLGGCGLSTLTSGFGGSVLSGGAAQKQSGGSLTADQMLTAAKSDGASTGSISGIGGDVSFGCPKVIVSSKEHQLTVFEAGRTGDALAVMHRGELTKTARECHVSPGLVTVKYGFSGVIRLGPKGRSGAITLPVQLSVADGQKSRVKTERITVQANVNVENPIGYFSHVQTVTFEVPPGSRPGEFELMLGFENADAAAG